MTGHETDAYPALADGLRAATESAAQVWRAGADALTAQAEVIARFPWPDPVPGIDRYFELLRQATEANQQLAAQWAAAVRSMTEALVPPAPVPGTAGTAGTAGSGGSAGRDAAGDADTATGPAPVGPPAAVGPAPIPVVAQVTAAPDAGARPRRTRATATPTVAGRRGRTSGTGTTPDTTAPDPRAAYLRMGKAAVSARLAERGLPRTGTLAQLVNRLVEAEAAG